MRGAEGDDGLAGEVGLLDERIDWPGRETPPDWIADKDGIIGVPIRNGCGFEGNVLERRVVVFFRNT